MADEGAKAPSVPAEGPSVHEQDRLPSPTSIHTGQHFQPKWRPAVDAVLKAAFPRSVLGVLGRIFGALSLFALLQHGARFGLSATFVIIVDIYNVALRATIGLLDPTVKAFIHWVRDTFSITLPFSDGWRHIFVILQILFIRDAGTAFSDGRRSLGIVRVLVGTCISFTASVFAFAADLNDPLASNVVLCIIPLVGLLVYDLIMYAFSATYFFDAVGAGEMDESKSRGAFFLTGVKRSFVRFFLVSTASLLLFTIPWGRGLAFPHGGLLAMTIGLIANATYWLFMGSTYAMQQYRQGKNYRTAFLESESGRFGLSVLGLLFWFALFCSLNAGMRLLGF